MPHIVLLGDSIFDNAAYVGSGPDVITQLRGVLPSSWKATLLAVDGAVSADVSYQIERIPKDATHLVVSVGGNDALGHVGILEERATSSAGVLMRLADLAEGFSRRYRRTLDDVLRRRLPTIACTIYEGNFPDPVMQRLARTALMVFNDAIVRHAVETETDLIDLRLICREPGDYANPIEPSVQGGERIAQAIVTAITAGDGAKRHTRVVRG
jgi:hypothetical protein